MPFEEWGNLYTNECINKWNPSSVQFYNFGVMITHSENWQKMVRMQKWIVYGWKTLLSS